MRCTFPSDTATMGDDGGRHRSHTAIVRMARQDTVRAPAQHRESDKLNGVGAGGHGTGEGGGVKESRPWTPTDTFEFVLKRLGRVAEVVNKEGDVGQSKPTALAFTVVAYVQVL
jgi:hypothetical protein